MYWYLRPVVKTAIGKPPTAGKCYSMLPGNLYDYQNIIVQVQSVVKINHSLILKLLCFIVTTDVYIVKIKCYTMNKGKWVKCRERFLGRRAEHNKLNIHRLIFIISMISPCIKHNTSMKGKWLAFSGVRFYFSINYWGLEESNHIFSEYTFYRIYQFLTCFIRISSVRFDIPFYCNNCTMSGFSYME